MVPMRLASREFAGRSTFSMSLQGPLTPCLKCAPFFSLPSRLCALCEIVGLETLISYRFFDNISCTIVTVCEKKKEKKES